MPTIAELGQLVKRKYPGAYNDIPDEELGTRIQQKYPGAYNDFTGATATSRTRITNFGPGKLGAVGNTLGALAAVGEGAAKQVVNTGLGLGNLAVRGARGISNFLSKRVPTDTLKGALGASTNFYNDVSNQLTGMQQNVKNLDVEYGRVSSAPTGPAENVGSFLTDLAVLGSPDVSSKVNQGKAIMKGLSFTKGASKLTGALKPLGYVTTKIMEALPEAALGAGFEGTQNRNMTTGALTFGGLSALGSAGGDVLRSVKGSLSQNVGRALGMTTKLNASTAPEKIPQAVRALKVIDKLSPGIKVVDESGVTKPFVPAKATFSDTVQALKQAKDQVYGEYSGLATQAGEQGASFTGHDFGQVIDGLNTLTKDSTSAVKNKVAQIIGDIQQNFMETNSKGARYFGNVDFSRIQKYLEALNTDVNPLSDKAGAEVSGRASQLIRGILDSKISGATGGQYQVLRSSYGDLKSIETELINQFKKAARNQGLATGFGQYVDAFGDLDVLTGLLTSNPAEMARGAGKKAIFQVLKKLRDPEFNLRNAFKAIQAESTPASQGTIRAFGGGPTSNAGNDAIKSLTKKVQNLPIGLSIQDVTQVPKGDAAVVRAANGNKYQVFGADWLGVDAQGNQVPTGLRHIEGQNIWAVRPTAASKIQANLDRGIKNVVVIANDSTKGLDTNPLFHQFVKNQIIQNVPNGERIIAAAEKKFPEFATRPDTAGFQAMAQAVKQSGGNIEQYRALASESEGLVKAGQTSYIATIQRLIKDNAHPSYPVKVILSNVKEVAQPQSLNTIAGETGITAPHLQMRSGHLILNPETSPALQSAVSSAKPLNQTTIQRSVGITPSVSNPDINPEMAAKISQYKNLLSAGKYDEAKTIANDITSTGKKQLEETFRGTGIKLDVKPSEANYFQEQEPTLIVNAKMPKTLEGQFVRKMAEQGKSWGQDTIHISQVLPKFDQTAIFGKRFADGYVFEPNIDFHLPRPLTDAEKKVVSDAVQGQGLAGLTFHPDGSGFNIYNVSAFKKYAQFYKEAKKVQDVLDGIYRSGTLSNGQASGVTVKQSTRRLLIIGNQDSGASRGYGDIASYISPAERSPVKSSQTSLKSLPSRQIFVTKKKSLK